MQMFKNTGGNVDYYHETAYFGWQNKDAALVGLVMGYKESADQLVDYILESKNEGIREKFVFPVVFCYRHSIEVFLKLIYSRAKRDFPDGHTLVNLWDKLKSDVVDGVLNDKDTIDEMRKINPSVIPPKISDDEIRKIRLLLVQLQNADFDKSERKKHNNVDQNGDVWRYLMDADGDLYFNHGHGIHYPTLKGAIDELYNMLYGLYVETDKFLSVE